MKNKKEGNSRGTKPFGSPLIVIYYNIIQRSEMSKILKSLINSLTRNKKINY
jgi:RNA binding exosome subunit